MKTVIKIVDDDGEDLYKVSYNKLINEKDLEEVLEEVERRCRRKVAYYKLINGEKLNDILPPG